MAFKPAYIMSAFIILAAAPAAAQNTASPLDAVYACSAIADNTERLACFDAQVAGLKVKEQKKEIVAIDAVSAKTIKREAFGFNLPSLPKLGLPDLGGDSKAPDKLTYAVKTVRKRGRDYEFVMENGQIWKQVTGHFNYIPKGDLEATISKGAIGSYRMSLSNGKERVRGMGVRRTQ